MATTTRTKKPTAGAASPTSKPKKASSPRGKVKSKSRAVVRDVEAGSSVDCVHCGERVKFQAKMRNKQVICNVYVNGSWNRVEHFHAECYGPAGEPYGHADSSTDHRRAAANAASTRPASASPPTPTTRKSRTR